MSWTPGVGVHASIGLDVGCNEPVDLSARRADGVAELVLGREVATIQLEPCHLEAIRDQLPGVLADLGVVEAAERQAAEAGNRTAELAAYLTDQTQTAEQAGEQERAGELRAMADKLMAAAHELELALAAVGTAAHAADDTAEDAKRLLDNRVAEEHRANGHPGRRPALS